MKMFVFWLWSHRLRHDLSNNNNVEVSFYLTVARVFVMSRFSLTLNVWE